MNENKKEAKVKINGKETTIVVRKPSIKIDNDAKMVASREFNRAVQNKVPLETTLDKGTKDQVWTDEHKAEAERIAAFLDDAALKLSKPAKHGLTERKARELAIEMRRQRRDFENLTAARRRLFQYTAEAMAEQAKFNYLVFACTVYEEEDKGRVFESVDEYLSRLGDDDEVAVMASWMLSGLLYKINPDYYKRNHENIFLLKHKMCDDDLRLVNKDGKYVDIEGHLVNKDDQRIDAEGNVIKPAEEAPDEGPEFLPEEEEAKTSTA